MVQKRTSKPPQAALPSAGEAPAAKKRGRPRAFAPDVALGRALEVFRDGGFAATSLDDLSTAMGINRPSLYGAFGDKRELFLKAYERYREEAAGRFAPVFEPQRSLREALELLFLTALDFYLEGDNGPRGCFTVMTAGSEAMADPEIRGTVQRAISATDKSLTGLFTAAVARGELPAGSDVPVLVQLVGSTLQTIALRARARFPRAELEAIARRTVDLACAGALRHA